MSGVPPLSMPGGKLPLPGEGSSDLDQIESALDRLLERRIPFFAWAPKWRSILLVACTVSSSYCTYRHFAPAVMTYITGAPALAHPMDTHVPGLDRISP